VRVNDGVMGSSTKSTLL